jgi:hypothetical protein
METTFHEAAIDIPRHLRPAGIAGWAATVFLLAGQIFMQTSGSAEPAFDAPAAEIQRYFETRDPGLFAVGCYLEVLGLLALLWFVCGLSAALRRPAAQPGWLPTVVLASGTAAVGAVLLGAGQAAGFRAGDGLDPQLARFAFDLGSITFANAWVALGSLSIASGWAILAGRAQPAWLGWWALAAGVGFLAARAVWTTPVWLIPYALFWLWVVVVSTRMLQLRRPTPNHAPRWP